MELLESLNRTIKIALDDGRASSIQEAEAIFRELNLQICVGPDVQGNRALQAALLTLMNAAPRCFLGEVSIVGFLEFEFELGWYRGISVSHAARMHGVKVRTKRGNCPEICVGLVPASGTDSFQLSVCCFRNGFALIPGAAEISDREGLVAAGVASAGVALNEFFHYGYLMRQVAGQRRIVHELPGAGDRVLGDEETWCIGLGHLGQAFLWTFGLSTGSGDAPKVRLQDYDVVSRSSLSTGLLVREEDLLHKKATAVASKMEAVGFRCDARDEELSLDAPIRTSAAVVVAVDNIRLRRKLDRLQAQRVLEAGIGGDAATFMRAQLHVLPGGRRAEDIWSGSDPQATREISLSAPAYRTFLRDTQDECGLVQLAGKAVATSFVGAFVGATLYSLFTSNDACFDSLAYDLNALATH